MSHSNPTNNQRAQLGALQCLAVSAALLLLPGSAVAQLSTANSQLFRQGQDMVPGAGAADEVFGGVLATGDFDGDGFLDLAIGTPRENVAPVTEAGTVTVLYGSPRA